MAAAKRATKTPRKQAQSKGTGTKKLVIVESPAKAKTINRILGKNYVVKASMGHIRDLPTSREAVDVEAGFQPEYVIIDGKKKVIADLKKSARQAAEILLAADPDREGEAICWHLAEELKSVRKPIRRITFHEITPDAVRRALEEPREIDMNLVQAQQARRVLDRLVGYRISPILWRSVRPGLSAGRVQSVAVRLICEREEEIRSFQPEEYWSIAAELETPEGERFTARLYRIGEEKAQFGTYGFGIDAQRAQEIVADARQQEFRVESVTRRERRLSPRPPFITSTLQQEAARKLNFTARRTMAIAQSLYEGVEVQDGTVGLITYMRTDSVRVADEAAREARRYIEQTFGREFRPTRTRRFATKKGAQDAHEAIRPTSVLRTPESVKPYLSEEQYRLYRLIWERFVASQMSNAVFDVTTIEIQAGDYRFRASGSILKFPGFLRLYAADAEEETSNEAEAVGSALPEVAEGAALTLLELTPTQHFTEPPPRYTEASLVKALEELGIGRPSTYASIISTIQDRGYVQKVNGRFQPTDVGELVNRMLIRSFPDILEVGFTARMEAELDEVEEGKRNWVTMLRDFYEPFSAALAKAADRMYEERKRLEEETDVRCELCGRPMVIKWGRYGRFLGCSGYPECRNTKPLEGDQPRREPVRTGVRCPQCGQGELVQRRSRRGRIFYGCSAYPDCDFVIWDPPVPNRPCPQCGAPFLTLHRTKTRQYYQCYRREECGYRSEPEPVTEELPFETAPPTQEPPSTSKA